MDLSTDQCEILVLRGVRTELENELERLKKRVEEFAVRLEEGGRGHIADALRHAVKP